MSVRCESLWLWNTYKETLMKTATGGRQRNTRQHRRRKKKAKRGQQSKNNNKKRVDRDCMAHSYSRLWIIKSCDILYYESCVHDTNWNTVATNYMFVCISLLMRAGGTYALWVTHASVMLWRKWSKRQEKKRSDEMITGTDLCWK